MLQLAARSFRTVLLAIGLTSMVVAALARPAAADTGDVHANGSATKLERAADDLAPVEPQGRLRPEARQGAGLQSGAWHARVDQCRGDRQRVGTGQGPWC